jgi:OmpA-OmpF porin, OOP family
MQMTNGKKIVALLGFLAAAAAGPAAGQDRGIYVGAAGGVVQYQTACDDRAGVCDDKDGGFRGFVGYQFNKYFALEGAYANMGSVKLSGPAVDTETKTEGFDLLGVFTIPLTDRFSLLGKAGAYRMRAATEDASNGVNTGETSAGFAYGVGAGYDMGKIGIRGEFLRYDNVGGARVGEDSLFFLNVGVLFRFY